MFVAETAVGVQKLNGGRNIRKICDAFKPRFYIVIPICPFLPVEYRMCFFSYISSPLVKPQYLDSLVFLFVPLAAILHL